jgi:acyl-CoA thioesterase-1
MPPTPIVFCSTAAEKSGQSKAALDVVAARREPARPAARLVGKLPAALRCLTAALFLLAVAPAQAAEPVSIAVLGDSIAAGYGLPAAQAFPACLEVALKAKGRDVKVINAGVSGDTTAGGLARLDWTLADKPDLVIVELGGNDALRGLDPKSSEANLDAILAKLKSGGAKILLTGMLAPPNYGRDYGDAFNAIYARLAAKHGVPLYPFILDGVVAEAELNQADGIHPNAKGVEVLVERILPYVEKALDAKSGDS